MATADAGPSPRRFAGKIFPLISRYRVPFTLGFLLLSAVVYSVVSRPGGPGDPDVTERRLARLEARLAENPDDIRALYESGRLKFLKGPSSYASAAADFEGARDKGLADPELFKYLGVVYQGLGLYDFAGIEYRRYLNNRPGDLETRLSLAKIYYLKGDYAAAEAAYAQLAASHPRNPLVLENQALSAWRAGLAWAEPLAALRSLGGEAGGRADFVEGLISHGAGDHARAAELLGRAALSAAPELDKAEIYRALADSRHKLKDSDGAMEALRELLRLRPGDSEAVSLLARLEKAAARAAGKKKK